MKKLAIIDGHNFLWRSYSVPFEFYSEKRTPLHVVSTFLKLIRRAVKSVNCDGLVVVFDTETTNDNFKLSPDYKQNRKIFEKGQANPYQHLKFIKKALSFLGVNYLELLNIEADDVVATVATDFCKKSPNNKVFIFSTDTDFYQLVDRQISIIKLKANDIFEIINSTYIKDKLGIRPNQYVEFKSLVGDPADNITGVKGVGPVTAKKMVLKQIDFSFKDHFDVLELNRKLIGLNKMCKKQWRITDFIFQKEKLVLSNKVIFKQCRF